MTIPRESLQRSFKGPQRNLNGMMVLERFQKKNSIRTNAFGVQRTLLAGTGDHSEKDNFRSNYSSKVITLEITSGITL